MSRDTIDYSHGDTGTEPSTALNFEPNERPDSEHFDWWWYTVIQSLNGHVDEFDRLDSDDDGVVDEADYANDADASTYKNNDIDSDGDGVVDDSDRYDGVDPSDGNEGNVLTTDGNSVSWEPPIAARSYSDGSGIVNLSDAANIYTTSVADGNTLDILTATFVQPDGTPIPNDCDLVIATLDENGNGTHQSTILSGDGQTVYSEESGEPLDSYTNSTGSPQTVMVAVDNGQFNLGSGDSVEAFAGVQVEEQ